MNAKIQNWDNKVQQLKENYEKQVNTYEVSFREFIELEAQSDQNFFRWLFDEELENDFDSSLTEEQRKEYKRFLEDKNYNIFYVEDYGVDLDDAASLIYRVEEKLEWVNEQQLENPEGDAELLGFWEYDNGNLIGFISLEGKDKDGELKSDRWRIVRDFNKAQYEEAEVPYGVEHWAIEAYK